MKKWLMIGMVFLVGCSAIPLKKFQRGEASEDQYYKDNSACELDADKTVAENSHLTSPRWFWNNVYNKCMQSRGYRE